MYLMDAAQQALQGRSLYFLSHLSNDNDDDDHGNDIDTQQGQGQGLGLGQGNTLPQGVLLVPAAVYEFDPSPGKGQGLERGGKTTTGRRLDRERLIGTAEVVASIMPGDVLLLPAFGGRTEAGGGGGCDVDERTSHTDGEHPYEQQPDGGEAVGDVGDANVKTWHRVVSVDLFYARLKVSSCPPPPHCWLPHASLPSSWAPISALWTSPVCRLLPPTSGDMGTPITAFPSSSSSSSSSGKTSSTERQTQEGLERYCVYLTPIPSIHAALGALQSLPSLSSHVSSMDTRTAKPPTQPPHTRGTENRAPTIKKKTSNSNSKLKSTTRNVTKNKF